MADESHVIHGINWRQTLPFTNLFRGFKTAIHPSKMVLALVLIGLTFAGGWLFDKIFYKYDNPFDQLIRGVEVGETARAGGLIQALNRVVTHTLAGEFFYPNGVIGSVIGFFAEIVDYVLRFPLFFAGFFLYFTLLWSIFGGAIARIAAVQIARDEKISLRAAVRFSISKILSFFFAPVIPLIIVLLLGFGMSLVAIIGNIPWVGMPVMGLFFFLFILGAFLMTLVLLGMVGGFNLMYPTIAVEGSDSFDAISRSFSYLFARPWRLGFYTLVAIVYGALTYFFLKLILFIILSLTHHFVDVGMWTRAKDAPAPSPVVAPLSATDARPARGSSTRELWHQVWPAPNFDQLSSYTPNYSALNSADSFGARLVAFWVYLTLSILGAYAISYYFCANTIVYYLMRQEVDATALDDVFVEPGDDDFAETPAAPVTTTAPVASPGNIVPEGSAASDAPAAPVSPTFEAPPPALDKPSDPV